MNSIAFSRFASTIVLFAFVAAVPVFAHEPAPIDVPISITADQAFDAVETQTDRLSGLLYRVDYEDGSTAASTGTSKEELTGGGTITVVDNPYPDSRNSSSKSTLR